MAFEPVNELERSLVRAASEPAHRPKFYRDFLGSEIFVVRQGPVPAEEVQLTLEKGEEVQFPTVEHNGTTFLPVFSSLIRLETFIHAKKGYLALQARNFLELTRCAPLFLNPGSDYGKEFTGPELQALLDGSVWRPSGRRVAEKGTRVLMGAPGNYPSDLVAALRQLFKKSKEVRRAYVLHFHDPDSGEKAHTLVAVEVSDDWDRIVAEAGIVARDIQVPDPPVDFIQIYEGDKIDSLVRDKYKPFYERKRFALF